MGGLVRVHLDEVALALAGALGVRGVEVVLVDAAHLLVDSTLVELAKRGVGPVALAVAARHVVSFRTEQYYCDLLGQYSIIIAHFTQKVNKACVFWGGINRVIRRLLRTSLRRRYRRCHRA